MFTPTCPATPSLRRSSNVARTLAGPNGICATSVAILLGDAAKTGDVRTDIVPDELTTYFVHALQPRLPSNPRLPCIAWSGHSGRLAASSRTNLRPIDLRRCACRSSGTCATA
jgi:hypothetical protein